MPRRRGNPAIIAVGGRVRREGREGRPISFGTQAAFDNFQARFRASSRCHAGVHRLKAEKPEASAHPGGGRAS